MAAKLLAWKRNRTETVKKLREIGLIMNEHAYNAKIACATGDGTSLTTGLGAVVCCVAAPFTSGASIGLLGYFLTGLAIAGIVTSLGASATNMLIENGYFKAAQKTLDEDRKSLEALQKDVAKAQEYGLKEGVKTYCAVIQNISTSVQIVAYVARKLKVPERTAAFLLQVGERARIAGNLVSVLTLPVDIYFFVRNVIDLSEGNVSEAAQKVIGLADLLEEERKDIEKKLKDIIFDI